MDKKIVLWATLRRLKSSGFYSWDEDDLAFVRGVVSQPTFEDCLQFVTERFTNYIESNEERKEKAEEQYEQRASEIEHWFTSYKPILEDELKRLPKGV
ncbi:MAG: hypothetical protein J6I79_04345 [Paludibacteraceae bacterium]|nr:hypothetical protein [Paludibacteraceae bacterium]